MKKRNQFGLDTITDIKIFLLFLLDRIGNPIDHTSLIDIVSENTREITLDYDQCLSELVDAGHLYFDEVDGEKYYMISELGHSVSAELYDSLDEGFREKSVRSAIKHISLSARNASVKSYITETEGKRYAVTMIATDRYGEILNTTITVASRAEAEAIKSNYDAHYDAVYRGMLFSATGRMEFLS
ncbi:MAG: DUF4364 family protein [Clostridia bacterium]|nr:DUF4364 family protein [Clostridia bacterium]